MGNFFEPCIYFFSRYSKNSLICKILTSIFNFFINLWENSFCYNVLSNDEVLDNAYKKSFARRIMDFVLNLIKSHMDSSIIAVS